MQLWRLGSPKICHGKLETQSWYKFLTERWHAEDPIRAMIQFESESWRD